MQTNSPTSSPATIDTAHPLVLVVDDHQDIRALLIDWLEFWGYRSVPAANGREALDVLESGEPVSLILLDLMMPVMDGWTFRKNQLRRPGLDTIPTAVLTAVPRDLQHCGELQVAHCLTKPLDLDILEHVVHELAPVTGTA